MLNTPVARLTIIAEYDDIPDHEHLETVLDELRGSGTLKEAKLYILKEVVKDLR